MDKGKGWTNENCKKSEFFFFWDAWLLDSFNVHSSLERAWIFFPGKTSGKSIREKKSNIIFFPLGHKPVSMLFYFWGLYRLEKKRTSNCFNAPTDNGTTIFSLSLSGVSVYQIKKIYFRSNQKSENKTNRNYYYFYFSVDFLMISCSVVSFVLFSCLLLFFTVTVRTTNQTPIYLCVLHWLQVSLDCHWWKKFRSFFWQCEREGER